MGCSVGDVLEFEAKRGLGITRRGHSDSDADAAGSHSPPSGRSGKPRAARTNGASRKIASASYVGSSEDGSGADTRSEDSDAGSDDQSEGASSDHDEDEDEGTGKKATQRKRKTVCLMWSSVMRCADIWTRWPPRTIQIPSNARRVSIALGTFAVFRRTQSLNIAKTSLVAIHDRRPRLITIHIIFHPCIPHTSSAP